MHPTELHDLSTILSTDDLRDLLAHAADIISLGSNQGIIEWISPSVTQPLGWAPADMIGRPWLEFVHPDDLTVVRDVQHDLANGRQRSLEVRVRHVDDTHRWMSIRVRPLVAADGTVTGRAATWRNIDDRVNAHETAVRAVASLRATIDALPDPYVVAVARRDASGTAVDFLVTEANTAACRFMGWERPVVAGIPVSGMMAPEPADRYLRTFSAVLASREVRSTSRHVVDNGPRGAIRYYDARCVPIDDDHVGFTWRDVTDEVEHDRALAALATFEALADERERLARDLHDGAIQHIYATGMLLQAVSTQAPADTRDGLERIIDRQTAIIAELRATIRGLVAPELIGVSTSTRFEQIVDDARRPLGFDPTTTGHTALDTVDDPALVQHLLYAVREMLSNVARHAAATAVQITVEVTPTAATVEVVDNGVGIAPAARQRPDARADDSADDGTRAAGGGLGLSNLRRRAQLLGGSFELTAHTPEGTVARWTALR